METMEPAAMALLASGKQPLTAFQLNVLQALCKVPRGKVTTYTNLAQHVQCGSRQAVGQALRRNPYAPQVPCHRVVAHSRSMGGFGGARDGVKIDKKWQMLKEEGVLFDKDGLVDQSCIFDFTSAAESEEQL